MHTDRPQLTRKPSGSYIQYIHNEPLTHVDPVLELAANERALSAKAIKHTNLQNNLNLQLSDRDLHFKCVRTTYQ